MIEYIEITKRFDKISPFSINDYIKLDGYKVLKKVLKMKQSDVINEITLSKITGRGGAGFPVSVKMKSFANESGIKYVVCNADEGEPGNFKDRYLMEKDPHQIIEGMLISAYSTGATYGYIYIRGEYSDAIRTIKHAVDEAYKNKYLGTNILGSDFSFDIEIRRGAGAYICGEEFSLIESIEGKAGRVRVKPPYPTEQGVYNKPTLLNNVETFCNLPFILRIGGKEYSKIGNEFETGTKLISLSGTVKKTGVFEVPFGTTIRDVIEVLGGGTLENKKIKMVQLGGASGVIIPESLLDVEIDNEKFANFDSKIGAGAIIVIDERFDLFDLVLKNMDFFKHESCGKCTPCREGTVQLYKLVEKIANGTGQLKDLEKLKELSINVKENSLCGLGMAAPNPILCTLEYFYDEYLERINENHSNNSDNKGFISDATIRR
jgi:NADH-quinone oxidoreductase subunit F